MKRIRYLLATAVIAACRIATVSAQPRTKATDLPAKSQAKSLNGEWRTYGADKGFTRYSPLDQIDRDNVKKTCALPGSARL